MSNIAGPNIKSSKLLQSYDASNFKSNALVKPSLVNPVWSTGSGSITGFEANGLTVENERVIATDPWGNNAVVWETRPTGTADADGGWNTNYFTIDRSKLYRFSVWVRRTSSTGAGTVYLGTNANGDGVYSVSDGTLKGNPYWDCVNAGSYTQNQWYLVVGHIFPFQTTSTTNHSDTGVYTIESGRVRQVNFCNIVSDLKWAPNSTSGQLRVYHYYCGDATTRVQFLSPRVDLCDGSELSIANLLNIPQNRLTDLSGNQMHAKYIGTTQLPYVSNGETVFSNGSYATISMSKTAANNIGHTWEAVVKPAATSDAGLFGHVTSSGCYYFCNGGICIMSGSYHFNWYDNSVYQFLNSGVSAVIGQYAHITCTWNGTSNTARIYVNGILRNTSAAQNMNYNGSINLAYLGYFAASGVTFNGQISNAKYYYDKCLTDAEVSDNFNALRSRFGL